MTTAISRWLTTLAAAIVLGVLALFSVAKASEEMRFAYFHFPDFTYTDDDGLPAGSVNEISANLAERAGYRWIGTELPPRRFSAAIARGDEHAAIVTPALLKADHVFVSEEDAATVRLMAYTLEGARPVRSLDDLQGRAAILRFGYSYGGIRSFFDEPRNGVVITGEAHSTKQAVDMLAAGRGDVLLEYPNHIRHLPAERKLVRLIGHDLRRIPLFLIVSKRAPSAEEKFTRLSAALRAFNREKRDPGLLTD